MPKTAHPAIPPADPLPPRWVRFLALPALVLFGAAFSLWFAVEYVRDYLACRRAARAGIGGF